MKTKIYWLLALVYFLLALPSAWAHHGGGGAAGNLFNQTLTGRLLSPNTNVFFTFQANSIDEGVGTFFLYQIDGEYALNRRFSIGATIPVWTVRQKFTPDNTKLGDVMLRLKGELWRHAQGTANLLMGLDTSFPTGNDEVSLGAGAVGFLPYFSFNKNFKVLQIYTKVAGSFEVDGAVNPTLGYEMALVFPVYQGKPVLDLLLGYQGFTFVDGDTFVEGSSKGYLVPGLFLGLSDHWETSFLTRISVLDTLGLKEDIETKNFVTSFFSDLEFGFMFNLGYRF
jgi:hypothetical protein